MSFPSVNNGNHRACIIKGYFGDEINVPYSSNDTVFNLKELIAKYFVSNNVNPVYLRLIWCYDGCRGKSLSDSERVISYDIPNNGFIHVDLAGHALTLKNNSNSNTPILEGEDKSCIICFDKAREYAPVPCGHTKYCLDCIKQINECSECRRTIIGIVKVYL